MKISVFKPLFAGAVICAASGAIAGDITVKNDLIPRDLLFGNPDRSSLKISPDGVNITFLAPLNDVMNVWVQPVSGGAAKAVTNSTDRPIRSYFWAGNSEQVIFMQDWAGDENFHLYAVDLATGNERDLTPFEKVQARLQGSDRQFPDEILVGVNNRNPQLHDVYRVNTRTGERKLVYENNEGWIGLVADSNLEIRVATRFNRDGGLDAFIRDSADDEWSNFAQWGMEDTLNSGPAGFSRDGKTFYMLDSTGVDTTGLYTIDMTSDNLDRKLVFASEQADINNFVADPKTGHPQALAWEFTRRTWKILDPTIQKDWDYLESVEDGEMLITSRNLADNLWTIAYVVDDGPVKYYLYDREAGKAKFLFTNRKSLEDVKLAKMNPVVIKSRDGLNLVSYLTTPVDMEPKGLPMVLLVHGGPWARDSWGYNPLHQWLANRGYAVLSVNFRGSTGMGKGFVNASNREWAGKMHDDLIDAVDWAVEEGIADPKRVAIMGGSYGGYATLVGLTFTPDYFAAGVDIVGPSHVRTLLETIPEYWKPIIVMFETRVGAMSEPEYLDSISPLTKVDQITKPLLIGQGANDPRVKVAESEQIVAAMQAKNIPVTYVVFPDEGHGFAKPTNNMAFFAITESFLAEHLGGRYQPIDDDVNNSTAEIPAGAELVVGLEKKGN